MNEPWSTALPEVVNQRGVSLQSIGVHETAWPLDLAQTITTALREHGFAILGGDVYDRAADGSFQPSYANWYCEIGRSEPWQTYAVRSCVHAAEYLRQLPPGSNGWFTVVASNKPTAMQLAVRHD